MRETSSENLTILVTHMMNMIYEIGAMWFSVSCICKALVLSQWLHMLPLSSFWNLLVLINLQEERSKVDELRGTPMSVGNLEEIIDDNHAIVSTSVGSEHYVSILSFVDKDQLEPGCSVLLNHKVGLGINESIIVLPYFLLESAEKGCQNKETKQNSFACLQK